MYKPVVTGLYYFVYKWNCFVGKTSGFKYECRRDFTDMFRCTNVMYIVYNKKAVSNITPKILKNSFEFCQLKLVWRQIVPLLATRWQEYSSVGTITYATEIDIWDIYWQTIYWNKMTQFVYSHGHCPLTGPRSKRRPLMEMSILWSLVKQLDPMNETSTRIFCTTHRTGYTDSST